MRFARLVLFIVALVVCCKIIALASEVDATTATTTTSSSAVIMDGFTAEQEQSLTENKENFKFQAEVDRLMDIIINSLYKHKDVFLRELISNASDALDKLRFLALSQPEILDANKELDIRISFNKDLKTLTIRDSGVGMTRQDLINNLGTVAKSGTSNFIEKLSEGADVSLIGQFGVGFYSVYLISDKVRVVSKNAADNQYIWESTADSSFTVSPDPRGNTLGRGTEITMFLKEDAAEFLEQTKLEELVKRYSEFINFPIYLHKKSTVTVEKEADAEAEEEEGDEEESDDIEVDEEDEKESEKPAATTEKVDKWDWERVNNNVAIWSRDKEDITNDEYQSFFKAITKDPTEAQTWIHFKAEGEVDFKSILFVPKDALNLYDDYSNRKAGIRLYVRKVLIQEDFEDLLPRYLNFIKGVVDSDDLPLNVSRETLQQHKVLRVMAKKLVRKILEMLRKMATGKSDDSEDSEEGSESTPDSSKSTDSNEKHPYIQFWEQFGKSIRMGVIEDPSNRSKLAKLLRFKSSKSGDNYVSLEDYIANKKDWQQDIYFVAGESLDAVKKSPFMEVATKKDIEVLYLVDPMDEYCFQHLADFDGHKLQSLTKEGLKFGDENEDLVKKRTKAYKETFKPLTKFLKEALGGKVSKVAVSQRVEKTPSVIETSQYGHTANMERIMRAQTFSSAESLKQMASQKTLELNPRHPIIITLNKLAQENPDDQNTKDMAQLVYETALLSSGFTNDDTEGFAERMYRVLASNMDLKDLDLAPEITIEEEAAEEGDEDANVNGNDEL